MSNAAVYMYYLLAAGAPFVIFSVSSSLHRREESPVRSITVILCQFVAKFPFFITIYSFLITVALSTFSVNQAIDNLNVAIDLNYYTKTSIRETEVKLILP